MHDQPEGFLNTQRREFRVALPLFPSLVNHESKEARNPRRGFGLHGAVTDEPLLVSTHAVTPVHSLEGGNLAVQRLLLSPTRQHEALHRIHRRRRERSTRRAHSAARIGARTLHALQPNCVIWCRHSIPASDSAFSMRVA
jgi:hypothetical protein